MRIRIQGQTDAVPHPPTGLNTACYRMPSLIVILRLPSSSEFNNSNRPPGGKIRCKQFVQAADRLASQG